MSEIREALQAAVGKVSAEAEPEAPVEVAEEVVPAPEPAEAESVEAAEPEKPKLERVRDETGKFAKKPAEPKAVTPKPGAKPAAAVPSEANPPSPAAAPLSEQPKPAEVAKAPQSWKPAAREHFAKLPAEVQGEVLRREREVQTALQESAPARKFHDEFRNVAARFAPILPAVHHQPIQAVESLLQTAATLHTGSAQQKAHLVASIVRSYGVSVEDLASALDGGQGQPAPAQQPQAQHIDPAAIAARVREDLLREAQQRSVQEQRTQAQRELETFRSSPEAEFFEDLKPQMGALIAGGLAPDLKTAYNMAVKLNPDVAAVIQQREAAKQANAAMASTQRARAAASSVKSQPAGVSTPAEPDSIRASLQAALKRSAG